MRHYGETSMCHIVWKHNGGGSRIAYCVLRIAYCVLRIAYGVLRIAYGVLRIAYGVLRIDNLAVS